MTRKSFSTRAALSLFALLSILVCAVTAAPPDTCSLLTPAQVGAVLGGTVEPGQATGKLCQWSLPNQPNTINAKKVTVVILDPRAFDYAKMPVNSPRIVKTPVSGIGDEAIYGVTSNTMATLTVKKGDTAFTVHVYGFPPEKAKEMEKTLALDVLSKL